MKRCFLFLIIGVVLWGCSEKKSDDYEIVYESDILKIMKLTEHIYLHESYLVTDEFGNVPCNGIIYSHGSESAVFDTPIDDVAANELIQWIENDLSNEIVMVVPLHYHNDNLGGLHAFHEHEIPSLAYHKTICLAKEYGMPLPQLSFDPKIELKVDGVTLFVEFLGEGHTADNVVVYFPWEKLLFGGCLVKGMGWNRGNLAEANVDAWAETVRKVKATFPETEIVVPGHGNVGGNELLDYTIELFE